MKVLLINGSPHKEGNTHRCLEEVAQTLHSEGIETEEVWIGKGPFYGCTACNYCSTHDSCVFKDDIVNVIANKLRASDGLIVGSPVHYASAGGAITSVLDRLFYSCPNEVFRHKPAAAIAIARRGGTTAAFDQLNKYFTISEMPVVSSQYWNIVHGAVSGEVEKDLEGMQIMRTLGRNMAWLLKCISAGDQAGVVRPEREAWQRTNFIR